MPLASQRPPPKTTIHMLKLGRIARRGAANKRTRKIPVIRLSRRSVVSTKSHPIRLSCSCAQKNLSAANETHKSPKTMNAPRPAIRAIHLRRDGANESTERLSYGIHGAQRAATGNCGRLDLDGAPKNLSAVNKTHKSSETTNSARPAGCAYPTWCGQHACQAPHVPFTVCAHPRRRWLTCACRLPSRRWTPPFSPPQ